ncbi:MAG: Chemotaxis protein CheA [Alphaproteobacteria bacterium ADurb.BinA305]|nr:MAG: Chemotaxis protein CheA [Alphaproteobacteria bacterium ADurb.BinA305]
MHDLSRELGKDIELELSGEDTELDKSVVERIADPLTHLVRNSLDHGIEPAEVRIAHGKPARGTLRLDARHDSGSIVIEVSDDGGGLNRERILERARERGLVRAGETPGDAETLKLIFEPGFSTAPAVTSLSGRGVGMDVVRRAIEALRGSIELESEPGHGTTVRIRLPLTLAIIDGFLVGVDGATYVVPLDNVVECVELAGATAREAERNGYLNLRGRVLPLLRLRAHFGLAGEPPRRENLVVVSYAGLQVGLVVDRLLGEFQTVIKPLGRLFTQVRGFSGATILGSGAVALILDVPGLIAAGQQAARSAPGLAA